MVPSSSASSSNKDKDKEEEVIAMQSSEVVHSDLNHLFPILVLNYVQMPLVNNNNHDSNRNTSSDQYYCCDIVF